MDQKTLEKTLADLPVGPVRYFDRIGSTNSEAARWADAGAPDLALVIADEQTAGRGRLGRRWHTPPGAALAFSLVIRLSAGIPRLTALGALAVCETLQDGYGLTAQIKWPNDVLVDRRKLAGILAEAHWQGDVLLAAILGIGINVAPGSVPPPETINFPATCVEDRLASQPSRQFPVDRWALLHDVLERLLAWLPQLESPEFLRAWEARLAFRGEWVLVYQDFRRQEIPPAGAAEDRPQASQPFVQEGQILGLAPDGALQLRGRSGEEFTVQVGEIHLRPMSET